MYKMELQWNRQGDWHPCVFPPTDYATALFRMKEYSQRNPEHRYRIFKTFVKP